MRDLALYEEPDLYDLLASPDPAPEVAFYLEEARRRGTTALELGCGTGRLAIPMAQAGLRVTGLDVLPVMLQRTKARATEAGVDIEIVQGDMRTFDLKGQRFDLIFIPNTTLPHLLDTADIVRCFTAVEKHLAPGGVFIFDVFNPSIEILNRKRGERHVRRRATHPQLGTVTLEETFDYDAASQINRVTWYWSTPERPDFFIHPLHMRHLYPQEVPLLLERAGLKLSARYGTIARAPFVGDSPRQICVCEATAKV